MNYKVNYSDDNSFKACYLDRYFIDWGFGKVTAEDNNFIMDINYIENFVDNFDFLNFH